MDETQKPKGPVERQVRPPVRYCDQCAWGRWESAGMITNPEPYWLGYKLVCDKGHKPRYYQPKSPVDDNWGYKLRCYDYREEMP